MSTSVVLDPQPRRVNWRLQRERTEVEAAILLVAGSTHYRVLLCGLQYGGRLAASCAGRAAAGGVLLETVPRDGHGIDIRVRRA
ncbi:MAG TPA: hypothetical protein VIV06_06230 [Candidatus Limnocylindrales bacterium]